MPVGRMGLVAVLLTAVVLAAAMQPVSVLRVITTAGDLLACRRMTDADRVTLVFTHSMFGGEVRETWRVDGDRLARVRIETDNAAAAEYYATDGRTRRVEDGFELVVPPLRVAELPFRVDRIGDHRLRFGADEISLAARISDSAGAVMSAVQVPLLARVVDRDAGCGG